MSTTMIRCEQLHKSFGKTNVLRGVNLEIPDGAIVGLLGNNGAGKSTLIKCLLGLLKATSGHSELFGEDSWDLTASAKSRLGYVPQEVKLYPWLRVRHVVDYTGSFYENWDSQRCHQLMEIWELDGAKYIRTLSTGQLQRLALVLAMGHNPELLVLDEPAASLDPAGRRAMLRSLLDANQDHGQTVLFSTHITSDLERVASHVAILGEGVVEFYGELDELKDSIKRVRIFRQESFPPDFEVPRSLHTAVSGQTAVAAVATCDDEYLDQLKHQFNASVDVEDLNLEEIFLEMHDA